ncbi:serine/threonine-protein kinase [Streptomyces exfoliatus]|uniref:serine/threonine-protein kinase n=1 Tax=Streptomyces exfoliatus TaxID=1905 RepID=UPI003C2ACF1E
MTRVRFTRKKKLGAGGQGEVWLVRDDQTSAEAVLKLPLESIDTSEGSPERARFEREVRIQSRLRHDGIMPILGIYRNAKGPFFTMPLAQASLEERLAAGPMTEEEGIQIIATICEAMEFAHSEGVLHRDLKPANILLLDGRWVVSDFGLCRDVNSDSLTITQVNTIVGSVAYMAPEQYDNAHEVAASADVFSIGRIFYYCLTGKPPFPYVKQDLIPPKFRYVITKAVSEEPTSRHQTVGEFRRELELLATEVHDLTPPMERARSLNMASLEGDAIATRALVKLLVENAEDEIFYKDFVPALSVDTLEELYNSSPSEFRQIVSTFDRFSEGGHPFSYTDVIADFFRKVGLVADDDDYYLRRMALRRILIVGGSHNRFYVGEMFARIISRMKRREDLVLVESLLRENSSDARFMAPYLRQYSLPGIIADALPGEV